MNLAEIALKNPLTAGIVILGAMAGSQLSGWIPSKQISDLQASIEKRNEAWNDLENRIIRVEDVLRHHEIRISRGASQLNDIQNVVHDIDTKLARMEMRQETMKDRLQLLKQE